MVNDIYPTFYDWQCVGQKVILRADLNVPLVNGTIMDDRRLQSICPTLDFLVAKRAMVILITHLGRPTNHDPALSTRCLVDWFRDRNYPITFASTLEKITNETIKPGSVVLFENIRFDPREKSGDISFARELKKIADWYVIDAFGALHRNDSSLGPLAQLYDPRHRSIGFLIEKEIKILNQLITNPQRPSCFILGGGKVADKIPLIQSLIPIADTIILCPALVFTFLKAQGKQTGLSLVDEALIKEVRIILEYAKKESVNIIVPYDYQIAYQNKDGRLSYTNADTFPADAVGISIGPKTVATIKDIIDQSNTVFYNGMMGFPERSETLIGVESVILAMAQSKAITIVAGGESTAIADRLKTRGITYCMTGGGATITYLAGKELPALVPFLKDGTKTNKTQSF